MRSTNNSSFVCVCFIFLVKAFADSSVCHESVAETPGSKPLAGKTFRILLEQSVVECRGRAV